MATASRRNSGEAYAVLPSDASADLAALTGPVRSYMVALGKALEHSVKNIPTSLPDTWASARVGLRDGRELHEQCRHYRGSIANPMSREERLSKVSACAQRSLQPADVARVISMVEALETLPDLRQLMVILGQKSVVA